MSLCLQQLQQSQSLQAGNSHRFHEQSIWRKPGLHLQCPGIRQLLCPWFYSKAARRLTRWTHKEIQQPCQPYHCLQLRLITPQPKDYFTIKIGHLIFCDTPFATLPKRNLSNPDLPCEPITTRSCLRDFAKLTMSFTTDFDARMWDFVETLLLCAIASSFSRCCFVTFFCLLMSSESARES